MEMGSKQMIYEAVHRSFQHLSQIAFPYVDQVLLMLLIQNTARVNVYLSNFYGL